jgi:hypothetical protein
VHLIGFITRIHLVLLDIGAVKTKQDTWEGIMWVMTQGHKKIIQPKSGRPQDPKMQVYHVASFTAKTDHYQQHVAGCNTANITLVTHDGLISEHAITT